MRIDVRSVPVPLRCRGMFAIVCSIALVLGVVSPARAAGTIVGEKTTTDFHMTLTTTSAGVLTVDVENFTAAPQRYGLGVTTADPAAVQYLWRTIGNSFAGAMQAEVGPGDLLSSAVPIRAGFRYVVYDDIDAATPHALLDWTAPGRFAPLSISGTDDAPVIAFGNPVRTSVPAVRAGESPRFTVDGLTGASQAEVWLLTAEQAEQDFQFETDRPLGFTHAGGRLLGTVPVVTGQADGPVAIPADLLPGKYVVLVGGSQDEWWPGGPALRFDQEGNEDVSNLVVEAGGPRGAAPVSAGSTTVTPLDQEGRAPVSFTFDGVTTAGTATVTTSTTGPTPSGFSPLVGAPAYYALESTARSDNPITICIRFDTTGLTDEEAAGQSLFHYVDGAWQDIAVSRDRGVVCGATTSFSPFAVGKKLQGWPFTGFLAPVVNDAVNTESAGSIVPIRFRLGADRGLKVLAAGSPASGTTDTCRVSATPHTTAATASALPVQLVYVKASKTYWYFWKTDKAWAGTCRQFQLKLADGTVHKAAFRFVKLTPGAVLRAVVAAY